MNSRFGCKQQSLPLGTQVLDLWLSVLCMRSKAWLAARVSLQLARTASSAQRSRHLRSTRAAAPVLFAHAEVTKHILFSMVQNLGTCKMEGFGVSVKLFFGQHLQIKKIRAILNIDIITLLEWITVSHYYTNQQRRRLARANGAQLWRITDQAAHTSTKIQLH